MLAVESLSRVQSVAESIRCGDTQWFPVAASPGDWVRQGDIKITFMAGVPDGATPGKQEAQLAPGTTKGSRHILDSLEGVTCYDHPVKDVLQGPVLQLSQERTVTHPDHGHWVLPPGTFNITYQRAYAEERRRVND
jgi:hypothetical protein